MISQSEINQFQSQKSVQFDYYIPINAIYLKNETLIEINWSIYSTQKKEIIHVEQQFISKKIRSEVDPKEKKVLQYLQINEEKYNNEKMNFQDFQKHLQDQLKKLQKGDQLEAGNCKVNSVQNITSENNSQKNAENNNNNFSFCFVVSDEEFFTKIFPKCIELGWGLYETYFQCFYDIKQEFYQLILLKEQILSFKEEIISQENMSQEQKNLILEQKKKQITKISNISPDVFKDLNNLAEFFGIQVQDQGKPADFWDKKDKKQSKSELQKQHSATSAAEIEQESEIKQKLEKFTIGQKQIQRLNTLVKIFMSWGNTSFHNLIGNSLYFKNLSINSQNSNNNIQNDKQQQQQQFSNDFALNFEVNQDFEDIPPPETQIQQSNNQSLIDKQQILELQKEQQELLEMQKQQQQKQQNNNPGSLVVNSERALNIPVNSERQGLVQNSGLNTNIALDINNPLAQLHKSLSQIADKKDEINADNTSNDGQYKKKKYFSEELITSYGYVRVEQLPNRARDYDLEDFFEKFNILQRGIFVEKYLDLAYVSFQSKEDAIKAFENQKHKKLLSNVVQISMISAEDFKDFYKRYLNDDFNQNAPSKNFPKPSVTNSNNNSVGQKKDDLQQDSYTSKYDKFDEGPNSKSLGYSSKFEGKDVKESGNNNNRERERDRDRDYRDKDRDRDYHGRENRDRESYKSSSSSQYDKYSTKQSYYGKYDNNNKYDKYGSSKYDNNSNKYDDRNRDRDRDRDRDRSRDYSGNKSRYNNDNYGSNSKKNHSGDYDY